VVDAAVVGAVVVVFAVYGLVSIAYDDATVVNVDDAFCC